MCNITPNAKNKYALDKKSLSKNPKNRCANASPTELLSKCRVFAT
jgi:hypothetical protein